MKLIFTFLFLLATCFPASSQQKKTGKIVPAKKTISKSGSKKITATTPAKQNIPKAKAIIPPAFTTSEATPINTGSTLNFNGQWRGSFVDNSAAFMGFKSDKIDYVLELETNGTEVTGSSYTYFTEDNKRYYTICKVRGTLNKATKDIAVTEFERTKYNTPEKYRNCFQTHKLKYFKQGEDSEMLAGSWIPAPDQTGDCGYGRTTLVRRIFKPKPVIVDSKPPFQTVKKDQPFRDMNREPKRIIVQKTKPVIPVLKDPVKKTNPTQLPVTKIEETNKQTVIIPPIQKEIKPENKLSQNFELRANNVLQTIQIKHKTFTVDFYDNGEIDGDSISVFFNGKLVLSHQRLTDKPLTITLNAEDNNSVNELIMYAENLGEIPPNTALMIVHDGDDRYEARISSDTEKNGAIRFRYNAKSFQNIK